MGKEGEPEDSGQRSGPCWLRPLPGRWLLVRRLDLGQWCLCRLSLAESSIDGFRSRRGYLCHPKKNILGFLSANAFVNELEMLLLEEQNEPHCVGGEQSLILPRESCSSFTEMHHISSSPTSLLSEPGRSNKSSFSLLPCLQNAFFFLPKPWILSPSLWTWW